MLDDESRHAIGAALNDDVGAAADASYTSSDLPDSPDETTAPEDVLWLALSMAPDEGSDISELMRVTEMSRPTLYRHLAQHAKGGRAVQVSRGRWRACITEEQSP